MLSKKQIGLTEKFIRLYRGYSKLDKNGPIRDDPGYWELEDKLRKMRKRLANILEKISE